MHTMRGLAVLSVLSVPLLARAVLWEVTPGNSIQEAVNQAANGDTVLIHDGLYTESVVLYGRTITLASMMLMDGDTNHVLQTVIQPDTTRPDTQSCVVYAYGEQPESRLVGLSLVNGRGTMRDPGDPDIWWGGGIYLDTSSVSVEWCRFEGCEADDGGGIYANGVSQWDLSKRLMVSDCYFRDCEGTYVEGIYVAAGGAIDVWQCTLACLRTVFDGDTVTGFGGALHCSGLITVDSCLIQNCQARLGGGFYFYSHGGHIADCVFDGNSSSYHYEAHLMICGENELVTRCVFRNAVSQRGSINAFGEGTRFVGNLIENNVATLVAGTIWDGTHATGEISYNIFRHNHSPMGGTLTCFMDNHDWIHHNIFEGNTTDSAGYGSAVISRSTESIVLDSNLFRGNRSPAVSFSDYIPPGCVPIHAENNWWGDPSGPYHPTLNPTGQGDTLLSDSVLFVPWLTEPPDTTMPPDYLAVRERPEVARTWELMDVYPNPFNQAVTLVVAGFTGQDFEIGLYNLLGQMVDVVHRGALTGGQLHYQAPPWLASGLYLLSAGDKHSIQTKKVILMK